MATDEPKRTADDLLKTYAQKRRDEAGAPLELHPATRRWLHDEVTRVFGKPAAEPRPNPLAGWWRRLAWSGAAVAVVAVAALVLSRGRNVGEPVQLAQTAKRPTADLPDRSRALVEYNRERISPGLAAPALAQRSPAGVDRAKAKAPMAAADSMASAVAGREEKRSPRFVQLDSRAQYRRNFNSPAPPPVLTSFQVERARDQIRIVDADGSIYEGQISAAQTGDNLRRLVVSAPTQFGATVRKDAVLSDNPATIAGPPSGRAAIAGENYAFRAAGTNRSLQQLVVFSGQFVTLPPSNDTGSRQRLLMRSGQSFPIAPAPGAAPAQTGTVNFPLAGPQSVAPPAVNASPVGVIQGQVVVGGTNEFNLEAVRMR